MEVLIIVVTFKYKIWIMEKDRSMHGHVFKGWGHRCALVFALKGVSCYGGGGSETEGREENHSALLVTCFTQTNAVAKK